MKRTVKIGSLLSDGEISYTYKHDLTTYKITFAIQNRISGYVLQIFFTRALWYTERHVIAAMMYDEEMVRNGLSVAVFKDNNEPFLNMDYKTELYMVDELFHDCIADDFREL